jgi:hypothetical protein
MLANFTGVTRMGGRFITVEIEGVQHLMKGGGAGVTQPLVPQLHCRRSRGMERRVERQPQRIEVAGAFTAELHRLRWNILDGKSMWVKLNRYIFITGKLFN